MSKKFMQNQLINIVSLPRAPPVTFVQFVFVIPFPILIPSHIITVSFRQFVFVLNTNIKLHLFVTCGAPLPAPAVCGFFWLFSLNAKKKQKKIP